MGSILGSCKKKILLDLNEKNIACFGVKTCKIEKYVVTTIVFVL